MNEQRRVGFMLPAEVFEQLLDELMYDEDPHTEKDFWEYLRSYYELSPLQGDTVICHPSFFQSLPGRVTDPPAWVSEQASLKKMQCFILAGPTRGAALLEILKAIEQMRSQTDDDEVPPNGV